MMERIEALEKWSHPDRKADFNNSTNKTFDTYYKNKINRDELWNKIDAECGYQCCQVKIKAKNK